MNVCAGLMEGSQSGRLPKRLTGSAKTAVGSSERPQLSLRMPPTPTGLQVPSSFIRIFSLVNWVSPTSPTIGWYPNRKDGGRLRGSRRPEEAKAILSRGR
jgi:hypothetical protein